MKNIPASVRARLLQVAEGEKKAFQHIHQISKSQPFFKKERLKTLKITGR